MPDLRDLIAVLDPTMPKSMVVPWPGGEMYEQRGWRLVPAGCVQDRSLCTSPVVAVDGRWVLVRDQSYEDTR